MKVFTLRTTFFFVAAAVLFSLGFDERPAPAPRSEQLIAEWTRAKAYTLDYLNAATDEVIAFKPTPEMRSFAMQMLHLADDNFGITAIASGTKSPTDFGVLEKAADQYKTKEALTKIVMDSYDFAIASLKGLDDAKLNETIKVFRWETTRELTYFKAFEHQTHHRGQTTVYLRLKGIKPPEERLF
jgi:uncharacterized damage-inducible protein DinB